METPLTKATFLPLINTIFKITFDEKNEYDAELIEVSAKGENPNPKRESFALLFRANRSNTIFAQRIYTIYSESTGPLNLFLIPRAPDEEGIYYEAIFN